MFAGEIIRRASALGALIGLLAFGWALVAAFSARNGLSDLAGVFTCLSLLLVTLNVQAITTEEIDFHAALDLGVVKLNLIALSLTAAASCILLLL